MDEILMLQEEIRELQAALAEELVSEAPESDPAEQLALQSTLTVLAERMSTIKMKAAGKRQLLEVTSHPEGAPPPAPATSKFNSWPGVDKPVGSFRDCHVYCSPSKEAGIVSGRAL